MAKYIDFAQTHVGIKDIPREPSHRAKKFNADDPVKMQQLFRRNPRRATRVALNKPNSSCGVDAAALKEKFFNETNAPFDTDIFKNEGTVPDPPEFSPFTALEIKTKVQKCENTAPGQDRLTYNQWKGIDPDFKATANIFNICMKAQKIPSSWKTSTTIFIPKEGNPDAPENWWPISLSCTLYKIFTGLIAACLSRWLEEHNILSPQQKGFRPYNGTLENNYMLEQRIRKAKKMKKELYLLFIDIKNAFGSVPHPVIMAALEGVGIRNEYSILIEDIYSELKTFLLTAEGLSDIIDVLCGVKQGCALSSVLFLLAIDPIVQAIQRHREECHALTYADDMGVVEDNLNDMLETEEY